MKIADILQALKSFLDDIKKEGFKVTFFRKIGFIEYPNKVRVLQDFVKGRNPDEVLNEDELLDITMTLLDYIKDREGTPAGGIPHTNFPAEAILENEFGAIKTRALLKINMLSPRTDTLKAFQDLKDKPDDEVDAYVKDFLKDNPIEKSNISWKAAGLSTSN